MIYPPVVKAIIDHNWVEFENLYRGREDLEINIPDHPNDNIISLICENDRDKKFKKVLLEKVIPDARDLNLEPTNPNAPGICSWACSYLDVDVAKELFKLPNFDINRLENNKTAPLRLVNRRERKEVLDMLNLLIDNGFNINDTHGGKTPTLLEGFLKAISKNVDAIQLLINRGADINAPSYYEKSKYNTIYDFAMSFGTEGYQKIRNMFQKAHDNK